jgi:hypothetical protein
VAIANLLHQDDAHPNNNNNIVVNVSLLSGLVPKPSVKDMPGHFLDVWDKYKDSLVTYDDPNEVAWVESKVPPPVHNNDGNNRTAKLLLGIFTMDSPTETERRAMIRKTYLGYFAKGKKTPHRICSLQELVADSSLASECQMAYTFVMGGNPNGPKELVEFNASHPMTVDNPQSNSSTSTSTTLQEKDIVYLNIQENMKEGKSQTWFKYATTVLDDHHYFDYIGKTDGDTLIYPNLFLKFTLNPLPIFPNNMRSYGGDYRIKPSTKGLNIGPVYMGGHLYFMSPDLARFITSPNCNRTALAVFSEDQSIGNFIHSHPLPIRRIRMSTRYFMHPVKKVKRWRTLWKKFLSGRQ